MPNPMSFFFILTLLNFAKSNTNDHTFFESEKKASLFYD